MGEKKQFLSAAEREIYLTIARTAIPGGKLFAEPGPDLVTRLENFVYRLGPAAQGGIRSLIWALEMKTVPRYGRRFSKLPVKKRLAALDAWQNGELTRLWLRGILAPMKMAYFNDPEIFKTLGCKFGVEPPAHEETFRWQQQILDGRDLDADEEIECDAVIVGTGAGGAPVAKELAQRGLAVLMLEEGQYFTRKDFNGRPAEMQRKMYRSGGATVTIGNTFIPVPVGKTVGGTTTINSGTCYRLPESTLRSWRDEMGLPEFTSDMLAPYYESVEEIIGVEEAKWQYIGGPGRVIARGCDVLGYDHKPLKRNAPECDGQGLCCFGCPTDAKRSTNVSYVPEALKNAAQLMTGVRVETILTDHGEATGVIGYVTNHQGKKIKLTVRAKVVVVACGTFHTPALLLKNKLANGSGQLGKNLTIHPASQCMALFDEEISPWNTIPQGYAIEEFVDEGITFEGATTPMDIMAAAMSLYGPRFTELMEQANRIAMFGYMVKDSSRGQVRLGPKGEPLLLYWLNKEDLGKMQRGMEILANVYFAAGAKQVFPGLSGWGVLNSTKDVQRMAKARVKARDFDITAYHPLGTARMGKDPRSSVVNITNECHDVRNLFICDGSAVPSSLGVNPQLTIMALATRASEFIARRIEARHAADEAA